MSRIIEDPDEAGDLRGDMYTSAADLRDTVVGHRITDVQREPSGAVITLDNGTRVRMVEEGDCCAYTELDAFLLHPEAVDHVITGVGTSGGFTTWHIFADMGDVLTLTVGWSEGSGYYGYGFQIQVIPEDA